MCHHVHGAYAQHSAVHIITMEHGIHIMVFVLLVEKDLLLPIIFEIIADRNKESRSTARRIYQDVIFDTKPICAISPETAFWAFSHFGAPKERCPATLYL